MNRAGGKEGVATLILSVCALACAFGLRGEAVDKLSARTAWILGPLERPASLLAEKFRLVGDFFADRSSLVNRISALQERNSQLAVEGALAEKAKMEADAQSSGEYLVDYREPGAWWDEVRLELHGNRIPSVGTPALLDGMLVGVVVRQLPHACQVRLITSSESFLPVVVESTRDLGLLVGDSRGGLWLRYTPPLELPVGSRVLTAMGSELLPPGLWVGGLTGERRENEPGLFEYRVSPAADLSRLHALSLMEVEP